MAVQVTGSTGVGEWRQVDAGCVPLLSNVNCSSLSANITAVYPAPTAASSPPAVTVTGTLNSGQCPVTGVTIAGGYMATALVPGFGAWSATIPLTVLEAQASCAGDAGAGADSGATMGYAVPVSALVPGNTGVSEWQGLASACASYAAVDPACSTPMIKLTSVYAASASGAPSLTIGGTLTPSNCPVTAMTLLNAYPVAAVGSSFAVWTATVPLAALEEQQRCAPSPDAGAPSGFEVSAQLVVPGPNGIGVLENSNTSCAPISGDPLPTCLAPTVTLTNSYTVTSGMSRSVVVGGSVQAGNVGRIQLRHLVCDGSSRRR
jgi:hypothetical protein